MSLDPNIKITNLQRRLREESSILQLHEYFIINCTDVLHDRLGSSVPESLTSHALWPRWRYKQVPTRLSKIMMWITILVAFLAVLWFVKSKEMVSDLLYQRSQVQPCDTSFYHSKPSMPMPQIAGIRTFSHGSWPVMEDMFIHEYDPRGRNAFPLPPWIPPKIADDNNS